MISMPGPKKVASEEIGKKGARTVMQEGKVQVARYRADYRADFERLNLEWIEKYFEVEEPDLKSLKDPEKYILEPGGEIFFVVENGIVKGTCALMRHTAERYELTKMAVTSGSQGRGYGNMLMEAIIHEAREKGAKELFLLSNTVLVPAIRLYEKYGFWTVRIGTHSEYKRANIEMMLDLSRKLLG